MVHTVSTLIDQLLERVSDLWLAALIGSFFTMICEAAKPKPGEGEARTEPHGFALWLGILSLLTPLLLFLHAFLSGGGALIAVIVAIGTAIIGSAVIGWAIAAFAPSFGGTLHRAAPALAVLSFALTLFVTWNSVFGFVNSFVAGLAR